MNPLKLTPLKLSKSFKQKTPRKRLSNYSSTAPRLKLWKLLREDLQTARQRDPAATSTWAVALTYPGVHALWTYRLAHRLWNNQHHLLALVLSATARNITGADIHPAAVLGRRLFIDHANGLVIGQTAELGNDCTLFHQVTLGGRSSHKGKRHPTLGNGVMVGAGAKILGPLQVGSGAKIGANAVVLADVPPHATAVGIPAQPTAN